MPLSKIYSLPDVPRLLGLTLFLAACNDVPPEAPLPDAERGAVVSTSLIERLSAQEVAADV